MIPRLVGRCPAPHRSAKVLRDLLTTKGETNARQKLLFVFKSLESAIA